MLKNKIYKNISFEITPVIAAVLLLMFMLVGSLIIVKHLKSERMRDMVYWESHLSQVAQTRASDIEALIYKRQYQVEGLAGNTSLRLLLTQLDEDPDGRSKIISAQKSHVKNLILSSLDKFNINSPGVDVNKVNLNYTSEYGLVVLNANKDVLMTSNNLQVNFDFEKEAIEYVYKAHKPKMIELHMSSGENVIYGFVAPVFKLQSSNEGKMVGAVMVLLNPYLDLYKLLEKRQVVTDTDESLLVERDGDIVSYISPLKNNFKIFHGLIDKNNLLASSRVLHVEAGISEKKDYLGEDVLVTGRRIKNSPWFIVHKISVKEALAESDKHQEYLLTVFVMTLLLISIAFIAVWKHSTSLQLRKLSHDLESRTILLDAVTRNIRDKIILLDRGYNIEFINPAFAEAFQLDLDCVNGVRAENLLGREFVNKVKSVSKNKMTALAMLSNDKPHDYHVTLTELVTGSYSGSKLYALHDITDLKTEEIKREKLAQGIISTLVKAVDMHDPHCENHSQRTSEVAYEIGKELKLNEKQLETLRMASLLANIGKLFVPKSVLTKLDKLSLEESEQLRRHIDYAVNILEELSFSGPVVDIISQKNERLDGSGYPAGLSKEEILPESKILAVANAFVAMTSSRAYREGRKVKEVINLLIEQSGSHYDRHVVAALFHIAENKVDWKSWYSVKTV